MRRAKSALSSWVIRVGAAAGRVPPAWRRATSPLGPSLASRPVGARAKGRQEPCEPKAARAGGTERDKPAYGGQALKSPSPWTPTRILRRGRS